jgi:hypothetical protein
MHRMGWESEGMQLVNYDPRIEASNDSSWFFAHLHPYL